MQKSQHQLIHQHATAMTFSNAEVLNERSRHVASPREQTEVSAHPSVECVCFSVRGVKLSGPNVSVGWPSGSKLKQIYTLLG